MSRLRAEAIVPSVQRCVFAGNQQIHKEKGAQPLRRVGRQKRVFRARAGREAGTSEPHLG
jgi:hypothetical protein